MRLKRAGSTTKALGPHPCALTDISTASTVLQKTAKVSPARHVCSQDWRRMSNGMDVLEMTGGAKTSCVLFPDLLRCQTPGQAALCRETSAKALLLHYTRNIPAKVQLLRQSRARSPSMACSPAETGCRPRVKVFITYDLCRGWQGSKCQAGLYTELV